MIGHILRCYGEKENIGQPLKVFGRTFGIGFLIMVIPLRKEVKMAKHYVWWIEGKKGGQGEWNSKKEAQKALDELKPLLRDPETQKIVRCEAEQCHCGRWTRKDLLEGLGECLSCDHVRGDVMDDMIASEYENVPEDDGLRYN